MFPETFLGLILELLLVIIIAYALFQFEFVDERYRRPVWFLGKLKWIAGPGLTWIPKPFVYKTPDVMVIKRSEEFTVEDVPTADNTPVRFKGTILYEIGSSRVKDFILKMSQGKDALLKLAITTTAGLIRAENYQDIKGHQDEFSSKVLEELNKQVDEFGVKVTYVGITDFDVTDESTRDSMAVQGRTTQDLASYRILASELATIAEQVGLPVGRLMELHFAKQMNTDGKGGFAFMMGDGKLPLQATIPTISEELTGMKSPAGSSDVLPKS